MAQTGFEVSPVLEFGVVRTLTVCSAVSPYILLSSSVYYRSSLCHFICCRDIPRNERHIHGQSSEYIEIRPRFLLLLLLCLKEIFKLSQLFSVTVLITF